ncbi:uncharacterized protein LOC111679004 [Lucilia cuprina]|uniref:uncharacterized protein LOC111679004 n=1 Tax=Lucilia cuprina TaxID=7375 RepID=UPI001F0643A5|nr:uncharacterized protein LOC111679004 [Lucilia cuprina]
MASRVDYKKKLMDYRKSIGTTTPKTVAFKEPTSQSDEDTSYNYPHLQRYQQFLAISPEKESIDENRKSASREPTNSKVPSPQPSVDILPTPGFVRESSFLSEPIGRYSNWNSHHALLASQPWCCIGDLMAFCDKYEFKAISVTDVQSHANIVSEVRSLLNGKAPFDMRRRFPGNIRNEENLLVCIGRCPSIEYHLERILTAFRRPLNKLSTEKQNVAKQNFHLAIRELHLDISARISEIRLYDRMIFEKEFHLKWQDSLE